MRKTGRMTINATDLHVINRLDRLIDTGPRPSISRVGRWFKPGEGPFFITYTHQMEEPGNLGIASIAVREHPETAVACFVLAAWGRVGSLLQQAPAGSKILGIPWSTMRWPGRRARSCTRANVRPAMVRHVTDGAKRRPSSVLRCIRLRLAHSSAFCEMDPCIGACLHLPTCLSRNVGRSSLSCVEQETYCKV